MIRGTNIDYEMWRGNDDGGNDDDDNVAFVPSAALNKSDRQTDRQRCEQASNLSLFSLESTIKNKHD
jgi:hypothetical protein